MNTITFRLKLKHDEGALVRLLGLVRRKRFDVVSLQANASTDGSYLDVQMTLQTSRPQSSLLPHIEKLLEASHVEMIESGESGREVRAARIAS